MPVADLDQLRVTYENPLGLLRDLRGMGETNALAARPRSFTSRSVLAGAASRYAAEAAAGRISASFQLLFLTAWAPSAGMKQPSRP
jgi:NADH dehydrogenase [ubiquinone] 1 alpha subcomplex assembly factor 5